MKQVSLLLCVLFCISCSSVKRYQKSGDETANLEYINSFNDALKQKVLGNYSSAEELLLKCIKSKPKQAVNYYQLSLLYFKLGETDKSLSFGLKAISFDKLNEWYYLHVIKLYQILNKPDSLLYNYLQIVKLKPHKVEYKIRLANLYYEYGYFKSSLRILKKIDGEKSLLSEVYLLKYKNYLSLNSRRKCLETLKQANKKLPYETRFYGLIAEFYTAIGKKDLALVNYKRLLKLDPNNEHGYLSLIDFYRNSGLYSEAYNASLNYIKNPDFSFINKAEIVRSYLNENGQINTLKDTIKSLIDNLGLIYPDDITIPLLKVDYYIKINEVLKAKALVQKSLDITKTDELIWEKYFYILTLENDYKSIKELSNEALTNVKNSPIIWLYYGVSLYELKRYNDAIQVLNTGIKFSLSTKNLLEKYYSYLGECYYLIRDYSKSDFCFESAIKLNNKRLIVLNNYSFYLAQRNERLDKALANILECLNIEPDNYLFLDTYAWILFKLNQYNDALVAIERAIVNGGNNRKDVMMHYCYILVALGKLDLAKANFKKLKELGFEDRQLKSILNE